MDIKRFPVNSLDQALKLWEDYHFVTKMQILLMTQGLLDLGSLGPTAHGDDFRQFLLEAGEETDFDALRFGVRKDQVREGNPVTVQATTLAINQQLQAQSLYHWSRHSRRVFRLPNDLVLLLRHTSLHNMTWGEVGWPFDAFAVALDTPVQCGDWQIDCCVVHPSGIPGDQNRWITGLDSRVRNWTGISRGRRKMYMRNVANKDWEQVRVNVTADFEAIRGQFLHALHLPIGSGNDKVVAAGRKFADHERSQGLEPLPVEVSEPLYRVVAGLSQYLKSLPTGSPHVERSDRILRTLDLDRRSIIAEADVSTVSSYYTLTGEEREILEKGQSPSGHEMCAHWRRGHWRKPMGMGDVPGAKKTIWVRPTLVRMDRLAEGTLPGGTMMTIELPGTDE